MSPMRQQFLGFRFSIMGLGGLLEFSFDGIADEFGSVGIASRNLTIYVLEQIGRNPHANKGGCVSASFRFSFFGCAHVVQIIKQR